MNRSVRMDVPFCLYANSRLTSAATGARLRWQQELRCFTRVRVGRVVRAHFPASPAYSAVKYFLSTSSSFEPSVKRPIISLPEIPPSNLPKLQKNLNESGTTK